MHQILRTLQRATHMQGPLMILAYTTKGWGLPIAGHLENHAALLTDGQLAALQEAHDIAAGAEWEGFAPQSLEQIWLHRSLARRGFPLPPPRRKLDPLLAACSCTGVGCHRLWGVGRPAGFVP